MSVYNIEIFTPDFKFISSAQIQNIDFECDYLDITKNKVEHPNLKASRGDYIRITGGKQKIIGIVSDVAREKDTVEIEYKDFMSLFDLSVYTAISEMTCIEEWLKSQIEKLYISSGDEYQNVQGLKVTTSSETVGVLDYEDKINNLFDIMVSAFTQYEIVINVDISIGLKTITMNIGKNTEKGFTVESHLPNVKKIKITLKEDAAIKNKVKIYNSADRTESVTYYLDADNQVTTEPSNRRLPVVYAEADAKATNKKTFAEVAAAKAESTLKSSKMDNLIEITCALNDPIIRPLERVIGQNVKIIMEDNTVYQSSLTGMEMDESEAVLIFGAIRLELTKQIKKWRREV